MKEVPTGIVSVTTILLAGMVPVFWSEIVYGARRSRVSNAGA
ncbi:hypothetical protein bcgnr5406_39020 [Bacillus cereus]